MGGGQMVDGRLHPDPGGRVLGEQRGRRRRRRSAACSAAERTRARRRRRRPQVQGGADQHAARGRALRRPGRRGRRQREEGRLQARRSAARRRRRRGGWRLLNTNEGKVIAASFADNYNGIVRAVRNDPSLQRDVGTLAQEAGKRTVKAGAVYNEGDVVMPKIGNVSSWPTPAEAARPSHARQGRRADLHGQGAGRLPQVESRQRAAAG